MKSIKFILLLLGINLITLSNDCISQVISGISCNNYYQEIKTEIKLPDQAENEVIKLFRTNNIFVAVTTNGVFKNNNGKWTGKLFGSGWRTAALDTKDEIWLASDFSIQKEDDTKKVDLPDFASKDTVLCLFWENEKILLVGTTKGLLAFDGKWNSVQFTKGKRINSIIKDTKGDLWVATTDGLLRRMKGKWINLDDNLMAYGLKRTYFSLENRNDDILFSGLYSVGCIAEDGNHWNLRGADGLPYGPVTTIRNSGMSIWFGTDRGAIKKDKGWHYYNGKRWLPDNKVNDILPIDEHTVWIATPEGISQIQDVEMSLVQKAEFFEDRIKLRHQRYGLVSRSQLIIPGDLSTSHTVTTSNDGLWTAIYLAAECFRYATTKDPEAKINAIKSFEAMERLETITGIPGFPARSFVAADESTESGGEWHLTPDKKWKWKGDTSSDEIVGHMFAYPLFYDLVADDKMKTRVKNLVQRIMDHIVDNKFQLVDLDGKPTRWAVWNPDSLNFSNNWLFEHGVNSLQILSFLKAGYHITQDQKFETAYQNLIRNHHYSENLIYQKMYGPYDINYVDNQLAFLPYYILFRYVNEDPQLPQYIKSMKRSWNIVQKDRTPMWNIIASVALNEDCNLQTALFELQQIPMDMITWTMTNSHRWDLPLDPINDRFNNKQSLRPIPAPERGITKWNLNNYQYDLGSDGAEENDGAFFLLAYWMGRYHGFFIEK